MPCKAREVLAKLQHVVLRHSDGRQTYVAIHTGDVPTGTFRSILKQSGITEEGFRKL